MRLLVTRPEAQALSLASELRALGHDAVIGPLLEFRCLEFDPTAFQGAAALIVTSANALEALSLKGALPCLVDIPLFCVGAKTAREAKARGFKTIAAAAETAEKLVPLMLGKLKGGQRLVHASGEHRAFDLDGALSAAGLHCCTLPVYTMTRAQAFGPEIASAIGNGEIHGVILMSPRTAEIFVSLCEDAQVVDAARNLFYFCVSANVARKLEGFGAHCVHVALRPDREAVLDLVNPASSGSSPAPGGFNKIS